MILVDNIEVWGWEHVVRGMRNPMNSWDQSDSDICIDCEDCKAEHHCEHNRSRMGNYFIGPDDMSLMQRLYRASLNGNFAHRKFLRQIFVSMDIVAPLYWWKEFDTYKVGTVANSCSTMHKIAAKEFELDDFSHEHLKSGMLKHLEDTIYMLNCARAIYINLKQKEDWWQMIQLLPTSYNQRRTVTMNYENAVSMILQRTGHKLDEWNMFVEVLQTLPYIKEITKEEKQ